jgi:tetratricopeptide (TPR) repeat protein
MSEGNAASLAGDAADLPRSVQQSLLNDLLTAAYRLHLSDQFVAAEALYRTILAAPSPHAAASYGLGLLCHARRDFAAAAEAFRRTIALQHDNVDAITNLGTALLALGESQAATEQFRRAITVKPDFALAHANLGKALQDRGELSEAIGAYTRAVTLDPGNSTTRANLGGALLNQRMYAESAAASQRAVELRPDMAMAHANLSTALFMLGRLDEALDAGRRAIALQPRDAMTQATLGGVMLELGAFEESAAACQHAIELNPKIAMAHYNLAHACKATNRLVEAEAACRRALALDGDHAGYHFELGHLLLLQGDFGGGWEEYEWRWKLSDFSWLGDFQAEVGQPEWKGEDLSGKTILLLTEQGLGDIILWVRYAPLLAERGARVIIAAHQPLHRLLASMRSVTVVPWTSRPWPGFDVYCPLVSLPRLCGTPYPGVSEPVPYLHADPASRTAWRQRLGSTGPRVGLVWGGNPRTKHDRFRSPRLAPMRPLFDLAGITFVVLQAGPARADIAATPLPPHMIDLGGELDDLPRRPRSCRSSTW